MAGTLFASAESPAHPPLRKRAVGVHLGSGSSWRCSAGWSPAFSLQAHSHAASCSKDPHDPFKGESV
jgi:hypothetical protein